LIMIRFLTTGGRMLKVPGRYSFILNGIYFRLANAANLRKTAEGNQKKSRGI